MTEEQILAEAEARANMQNDQPDGVPTEADFQKAEDEIRAEEEARLEKEHPIPTLDDLKAVLAERFGDSEKLDEVDRLFEDAEAAIEADDAAPEEQGPWINNGAVVTIQLLAKDFVGDPVDAAEEIMLDLIMHGLHRRAVVVTDMGDDEEYIVKDGKVVTPAEVAAAMAARDQD